MMSASPPVAPPPPTVRLNLGVTGHRAEHPAYRGNAQRIEAALGEVLDAIAAGLSSVKPPFGAPLAGVRLHSLLADGADQAAAQEALRRGWELVAPLPFGRDLNRAINALPQTAMDVDALLGARTPADAATARRADAISAFYAQAHLFELADRDAAITTAFRAMFVEPRDPAKADIFRADSSARVALAARLIIEQSDIVIAVWDGARTTFVGGTGHTVAAALDKGAPVVWIAPQSPQEWRILVAPEALNAPADPAPLATRKAQLARLAAAAVTSEEVADRAAKSGSHADGHAHARAYVGVDALGAAQWRARSNPLWHAYRRLEAVFGGEAGRNPLRPLQQTYEPPSAIAEGSARNISKALSKLTPGDSAFRDRIAQGVLARFAWADGISAHLSDTYRGGMIVNFALSALAVIAGVAYLPLVETAWKWPFALFELVLLSAILVITRLGQTRRWHGRWFETRRVGEYLRHAPMLLALGAARAPGSWPRGAETSWPEHYARHALREVGLPRVAVTPDYLRRVLTELILPHVAAQRAYHHNKARRLGAVHQNLDKLSQRAFQVAVVSVAIYLLIALAGSLHLVDKDALKEWAKIFTFLSVALPTFGAGVAGMRYFGDFERFAAISDVTAAKLAAIEARIAILLERPAGDTPGQILKTGELDYAAVAELAHGADEIVVSEIENWQAVFGGKHITVPV